MRQVFVFAVSVGAMVTALGPGASADIAAMQQAQAPAFAAPVNEKIPPADPHVAEALKTSRRHADWIDIKLAGGGVVRSWVVHPERPSKSGVVLVIHENRGITDWTRAVADQLAEDGFIAIAPDFLWGKGPDGAGTEALGAGGVSAALGALTRDEIIAKLNAAMEYGKSQPSSNGKTAVLGFCWGGRNSFDYAVAQPALNASVVFYGPSPQEPTAYASIKAPVLGLYGGNDARVNATIPTATEQLKALGKTYEPHTFEGAGHGFVHQRSEADYKATVQSWPLVLAFLNKHLK